MNKYCIQFDLLEVPEVLVGQKGVVPGGEHRVHGALRLPHVHHRVLVQVAVYSAVYYMIHACKYEVLGGCNNV